MYPQSRGHVTFASIPNNHIPPHRSACTCPIRRASDARTAFDSSVDLVQNPLLGLTVKRLTLSLADSQVYEEPWCRSRIWQQWPGWKGHREEMGQECNRCKRISGSCPRSPASSMETASKTMRFSTRKTILGGRGSVARWTRSVRRQTELALERTNTRGLQQLHFTYAVIRSMQ